MSVVLVGVGERLMCEMMKSLGRKLWCFFSILKVVLLVVLVSVSVVLSDLLSLLVVWCGLMVLLVRVWVLRRIVMLVLILVFVYVVGVMG